MLAQQLLYWPHLLKSSVLRERGCLQEKQKDYGKYHQKKQLDLYQ